jgi:hypothetical protein
VQGESIGTRRYLQGFLECYSLNVVRFSDDDILFEENLEINNSFRSGIKKYTDERK